MERTLCIFKPDLAARRANVAQALVRLIAVELLPVRMERMTISTPQALRLYSAHFGKPHNRRNIDFITSGRSVVMVLEGESAVERLRDIVGATDPTKAQRGTLRATFGSELPRNAVHATATAAEVEDEIAIFFERE
jgi:nucleoside-diphosphate kinase